jgi:hypothetical protein
MVSADDRVRADTGCAAAPGGAGPELDPPQLNREQAAAVEAFRRGLSSATGQPAHIFIHGGPGTGKSFVAKALRTAAREAGLHPVTTAFMGVAALPHRGLTLHSLLSISINKPPKPMGLNQKAAAIGKARDVAVDAATADGVPVSRDDVQIDARSLVLFIEEISQVSAPLLVKVNARLRELFGTGIEGLHVVLLGDMFQLPPPSELSLHHAMVQATQPSPSSVASQMHNILASFLRYLLTQPMRSPDDIPHCGMIMDLRDTTVGHPFTPEHAGRVAELSRADVVHDPSWRFALTSVTSNVERAVISEDQVEDFAVATGEPVFTWLCPLRLHGGGRGVGATYEDPPYVR